MIMAICLSFISLGGKNRTCWFVTLEIEMGLRFVAGQAKAERMKRRAQEKTASKLASAQAAAREKRAQAEAKLNRRAARVGDRADALRRTTGHLPSSSSVFSLKLPLMCS